VRRALICLAAAAVILAGCGNDRTPPPDIGVISRPHGFEPFTYRKEGIRVRVPVNWRVTNGVAPQVFAVASGDGQIALVAQVQARDPTFDVQSTRLILKDGLRAVELVGVGTNQGARRSVRSLHAYAHKGEVVVDAFAPPRDFARVDAQTFQPVLRSLTLRAPAT
jgi:hypothetical protein